MKLLVFHYLIIGKFMLQTLCSYVRIYPWGDPIQQRRMGIKYFPFTENKQFLKLNDRVGQHPLAWRIHQMLSSTTLGSKSTSVFRLKFPLVRVSSTIAAIQHWHRKSFTVGVVEFSSVLQCFSAVKMSTHYRAVISPWPYSVLNAAAVPPAQLSRRSSIIVLRKLLLWLISWDHDKSWMESAQHNYGEAAARSSIDSEGRTCEG